MLSNSFIHVPTIGAQTERLLWENKIMCWDDFLSSNSELPISNQKKKKISSHIKKSQTRLKKKDITFFKNYFPPSEMWRIYPEFKDSACFLDIETTGLSPDYHDVTVVGLFDGKKSKAYINGKNLGKLEKALDRFDLLVTFNGACFDLPFLNSSMGIQFHQAHIDLRFVLSRLGHTGGLKKIERQLGIGRETAGTTGLDAVYLWKAYKQNKWYKCNGIDYRGKSALDLLIKYNQEDIENLKTLMEYGYEKLKKEVMRK
ncbi:MAG: ribonuclease H-like domain-containing protein [Candidatus Altiarchaeota archaeon]